MKRTRWIHTQWTLIVLLSVMVGLAGGRPVAGQGPSGPEAPLAPVSPEAPLAPETHVPDDTFWNNTGLLAGANQSIRALSFVAGDLFVGGGFDRVAGIVANRTAYWDGQQWHAMGSGVGGLNAWWRISMPRPAAMCMLLARSAALAGSPPTASPAGTPAASSGSPWRPA